MDNAQRAQRVEDSKERQRLFMEQLQRKVQQRKDHADVSSKPCLAALLTSTAKKVWIFLCLEAHSCLPKQWKYPVHVLIFHQPFIIN